MNTEPSIEDYDSIIGLFLADHPESCTFERQQLGRAVVYVVGIQGHEAGRITIEPPTRQTPGVGIGHHMTAKKLGVLRAIAEHGKAERVPEPEAELNRRFLNIYRNIESEIDHKLPLSQLRRDYGEAGPLAANGGQAPRLTDEFVPPSADEGRKTYRGYNPKTARQIAEVMPQAYKDYNANGGKWGPKYIGKKAALNPVTVGRYLKVFRACRLTTINDVPLPSQ